jgi:hypothetical protein
MTPRQKITLGWLLLLGCGALANAQEFNYQHYMPSSEDAFMQYYRGECARRGAYNCLEKCHSGA